MGYVREQRATKLLEDTLLEWLEDGHIPTTGELQQAYLAAETKHGELTTSTLRQVDLPQRWALSSATQHNSVIEALNGDLDVLLRSLVQITNLGISTLGEWNSRAKSLQVRIENLKSRIESLLLLKSDSAGYVSFIEDGFLSLENVSSETTSNVDTRTGEVTLNIDRTDGSGEFQGTQIDLDNDAQVSWGLVEGGNVRYSANPEGSSLGNVLSDRTSRWGSEVNTIRPDRFRTANQNTKSVMGEMKIKLASQTSVSKLVLLSSDATAGSSSVVGAQYSTDGYTWNNVPSESPVQSGTGNFIWRFENTETTWVKFIVSKASPDFTQTVGTTYDFGFDRIKFYSETYEITEEGNQIVSETMTPQLGGSDVSFGRASLEVCEEVPVDTSIRYSLRAYDGSTYTNWIQVAPLSRDVTNVSSVVDFAAPTELSSSTLTTTLGSSIDSEALNIMRVDGVGSLDYRFGGPNDTCANFYIAQNDNLLTDLVLLRNRGSSSAKFPSSSTNEDLLVGNIQCGWGLDGDSIYYCVFLVNNPDGISIDFGPAQATLDGRVVSGVEPISPGWHKFRTDRANWADLSGSTVPTSTSELSSIDPLYPYNHKYLIEGYDYGTAWTGDKVYLGVDEYGQYLSSKIGRHNFLNSDTDLSIYALDVVSGPKTIILLKFDSSYSNHENERVRLFYTRRYDSFSGIQMKAVLKSNNVEKTPVLSYYRVRVK